MKAQMIRFADIPLDLIEQKEEFEQAAIPVLEASPSLYAFEMLKDDGTRIGVSWFVLDKIYGQLIADTIIIDEPHRGVKTMMESYKLMHDVGLELARALGVKRVIGTSDYPKLIERLYPSAKLKSYVYYEEV